MKKKGVSQSLNFPVFQFPSLPFLIYLFFLILGVTGLSSFTYSAFDDQFIGARAFAMGGAFTAIGSESDGLLVNPASISNVPSQQLSATMARLHAGLSDET
ncbi:MAG: hypothetical protein ACE1ZS_00635, partial [Candidatus Poribacteria bacterium]